MAAEIIAKVKKAVNQLGTTDRFFAKLNCAWYAEFDASAISNHGLEVWLYDERPTHRRSEFDGMTMSVIDGFMLVGLPKDQLERYKPRKESGLAFIRALGVLIRRAPRTHFSGAAKAALAKQAKHPMPPGAWEQVLNKAAQANDLNLLAGALHIYLMTHEVLGGIVHDKGGFSRKKLRSLEPYRGRDKSVSQSSLTTITQAFEKNDQEFIAVIEDWLEDRYDVFLNDSPPRLPV